MYYLPTSCVPHSCTYTLQMQLVALQLTSELGRDKFRETLFYHSVDIASMPVFLRIVIR